MRFFLPIFVLAVLAGCDLNTTTIKSEVKSPDGNYVATAFLNDAGATSSWSPQVHLRRVGERLEHVGNVFVGYRSPNIQIEWMSASRLVIYCDCEVIQQVTNYHGITIEKRTPK